MDAPQYIYLKVEIDSSGNSSLVGAWEGEPEVEPRGFGPTFPCRTYPGCYCVMYQGREVRVWCPYQASTTEETS